MSSKFTKTVKNARRGINFSRKFKHRLAGSLFLFLFLLFSCALLVWWQEPELAKGSYWSALWSVLFTLIGQGEFAARPATFVGRIVVFLLSIFGVALFGVVFAEVLQRLINSRLKEMLGMSSCRFRGHILICGWNGRGSHLIRQLAASGRQMAVIAEERPKDLLSLAGRELDPEVFFVQGSPSERDALIKGGIENAKAAIILGDPKTGGNDSQTILTGLAIESMAPEVYTVMELHDPAKGNYARYAQVNDILYSDSLIADITAMCTNYEGISPFIRDVLSTSDDGHSFAALDAPAEFAGRTIQELFEHFRAQNGLPIGVLVPSGGKSGAAPESDASGWVSRVDPSRGETVALPMKVVCIVKNNLVP